MVRIGTDQRLWKRYKWIAVWMLVTCALDMGQSASRTSWTFAVCWGYTEWVVLALQALAAVEVIRNLIRQYGTRNKAFLTGLSGALAIASVAISAVAAIWLEFRVFRFDQPLVQGAIAADRVVTLSCSVALFAALALMRKRPLPDLCRNMRLLSASLPSYFLACAVIWYLNLALWDRFDNHTTLVTLQVAWDVCTAAFALWTAGTMRPEHEWDFFPIVLPGREEREQAATAAAMRELRAATAAVIPELRAALRTLWEVLTGARRQPII